MTPLAPLLSTIVSAYLIVISVAFVLSDAMSNPNIFHTATIGGGAIDLLLIVGVVVVYQSLKRQPT